MERGKFDFSLLFNFFSLIIFACIICQIIFLHRILDNDIYYNCSDDKTNEVLRKERENTKKTILYTEINLGVDILIFLFNIFSLLIVYLSYNLNDIPFSFTKKNKFDLNKSNDNYPIKDYNSNGKKIDNITMTIENIGNNIKPAINNETNSQIVQMNELIESGNNDKNEINDKSTDNNEMNNQSLGNNNTVENKESNDNNTIENSEPIDLEENHSEIIIEIKENINYPDLDVPPPIIHKSLDTEE